MFSKHLNTWLAAFVAGFLVLVLPACWYGALARANALNVPGPSNANSNEEREEHEGHGEQEVVARGTRPPPPPTPGTKARASRPRIAAATRGPSIVVASVAPVPHPAQFSVRRLR